MIPSIQSPFLTPSMPTAQELVLNLVNTAYLKWSSHNSVEQYFTYLLSVANTLHYVRERECVQSVIDQLAKLKT